MQKIWDALKAIYDFITGFPQFLIDLFVNLVTSLLNMLKDLFFWIIETLLQLAAGLLDAIDLSPILSLTSNFGALPGEIVNVLALCRVGEALGIIVAALVIRFALQLIPFVRLGS